MSSTRDAVEARVYRELFIERLNIVADGAVYTKKRMMELFDCKASSVEEFVRLCQIHPYVEINRRRGANTEEAQFTFRKIRLQGADRVVELAKTIAEDETAGSRSQETARQIIATLGG